MTLMTMRRNYANAWDWKVPVRSSYFVICRRCAPFDWLLPWFSSRRMPLLPCPISSCLSMPVTTSKTCKSASRIACTGWWKTYLKRSIGIRRPPQRQHKCRQIVNGHDFWHVRRLIQMYEYLSGKIVGANLIKILDGQPENGTGRSEALRRYIGSVGAGWNSILDYPSRWMCRLVWEWMKDAHMRKSWLKIGLSVSLATLVFCFVKFWKRGLGRSSNATYGSL